MNEFGINIGGSGLHPNGKWVEIQDHKALQDFKDCSIPHIYASHMLEYLDDAEAMTMLRESHRVLVPGGTIQIAVPDFEAIAEVYKQTGVVLIGPLFGRMKKGREWIYHKTAFDFRRLRDALLMAGFGSIRKFEPHVDDCSRAEFQGTKISLNLQGTKP